MTLFVHRHGFSAPWLRALLALLASVTLQGCASCAPGPADGDADSDADGDAPTDSETDDDTRDAEPDLDLDLPLDGDLGDFERVTVLSIYDMQLSQDPLCDVDGDGANDNSLQHADQLWVRVLQELVTDDLRNSSVVPAVDTHLARDPATPHDPGFAGGLLRAEDSDTRSGNNDEPGQFLCPDADHYTQGDAGTGELVPAWPAWIGIDHGLLTARAEAFALLRLSDVEVIVRDVLVSGTVTPGMGEMTDALFCFRLDPRNLAQVPYPYDETYSVLDVLVSPGEQFGLPGLEGVQPDLDMDGDGLEVFVTDSDGRVDVCLDGDGTVIASSEERHCTATEEIADGYSTAFLVDAVWAYLILCLDECCTPE